MISLANKHTHKHIGDKTQLGNKIPRQQLLKKFHDFWDSLTKDERDDLYEILTSLRGPDKDDFGSEKVKTVLTKRFRKILMGAGWSCDEPYQKPDTDAFDFSQIDWDETKKLVGCHFTDHARSTILAIRRYVIIKEASK